MTGPKPPVLTADLTGKVVIVVGANTGLGFEAARHFATMNPAKLILACRDQAKGDAALKSLQDDTKFSRAEMWTVDLSSFESVQGFADKASAELERIDFLIENAAVAGLAFGLTADGWEQSIQTNNLGTDLLALLLVPKLLETAKKFSTLPRLVVVSSGVHYRVSGEPEVLKSANIHKKLSDKEYCTEAVMKERYNITKLLNVFFVRALAERLPRSDPTILVNNICPGYCFSELRRHAIKDPAMAAHFAEMDKNANTTEEGSRHIIYGALAGLGNKEEEEKLKGSYLSSSKMQPPSDLVLSDFGKATQEKLWVETIEILGNFDSRVLDIVNNL